MLDWLRLLRISGLVTIATNLVTAMVTAFYADGGLDVKPFAALIRNDPGRVFWVGLAGACLYLTGMVWNDLNDVDRDRLLKPRRPLPSGRVNLATAYVVGILLAVGTWLAASRIEYGFDAAGVVLALILLYDFTTKSVPVLGSLTMGLVRAGHAGFALLALGSDYLKMGVFHGASGTLADWLLAYPVILGLYIFGLTWISELESRSAKRWELLAGGALVTIAIALALTRLGSAHWLGYLYRSGGAGPLLMVVSLGFGLVIAGALVTLVGRPYVQALRSGRQVMVGTTVGAGLAGIILLDALVACSAHPLAALLILLMYPLFRGLSRLIRMD